MWRLIRRRLSNTYPMSGSAAAIELREEEYGVYDPAWDFEYLLRTDFIDYFDDVEISVPKCFRKTFSLRRPILELDMLRFSNYLMFQGLRYKSVTVLLTTFMKVTTALIQNRQYSKQALLNWQDFFLVSSGLVYGSSYLRPEFELERVLPLKSIMRTDTKVFGVKQLQSKAFTIVEAFVKLITKTLPMFSFYIYKVDKRIYKNTRRKSGKYTFIWKYITPYKRVSLVMFWLIRELKVAQGRSFLDRSDIALHNFFFNFKKT